MNTRTGSTEATLPHLDGPIFLSEAGLETDLVFHHGIDLPSFASFPLLDSDDGRATLDGYYESFVPVARRDGTGLVFETPTWRAHSDWGPGLGYSTDDLDRVNRDAVAFVRDIADRNPDVPIVVSGNVGPRGDGYQITELMSSEEAADYHRPQLTSLAAGGADMLSALTITNVEEAIGIVSVAHELGLPIALGFTVETDGRLPSGTALDVAIETVDRTTDGGPTYFVINCAHPTHFASVFESPGPWERIRGVRANASKMSHAELDEAEELDAGDPGDLAVALIALRAHLPQLALIGGCCGTDLRHVDAVSSALAAGR